MKNQLGDMTLRELAESLGFQECEYRELLKLVVQVGHSDLNEILLAQRENDPTKAAQAAHSLKGAALNVGLFALSEIANQVETLAETGSLSDAENAARMIGKRLNAIASWLS